MRGEPQLASHQPIHLPTSLAAAITPIPGHHRRPHQRLLPLLPSLDTTIGSLSGCHYTVARPKHVQRRRLGLVPSTTVAPICNYDVPLPHSSPTAKQIHQLLRQRGKPQVISNHTQIWNFYPSQGQNLRSRVVAHIRATRRLIVGRMFPKITSRRWLLTQHHHLLMGKSFMIERGKASQNKMMTPYLGPFIY